MTRLSIERPNASVQKGCSAPGGCRRPRRFWASGGTGASTGAKIATSTRARTMKSPTTAALLRRKRRMGAERQALVKALWLVAAAALRSVITDLRVESGVGEVHQQVDEHENKGDKEHRSLDEGQVAGADGVYQHAANAGPGEDGFGENGSAQKAAKLQTDHGDHRQQSVAEGVAQVHPRRRGSLRMCRTHVILAQGLDHAAPRYPRDKCARREADRDCRHDQVLPGAHARGRQPAQVERKDDHEDEPRPEDGDRDAGKCDDDRRVIDEGAAVDRRENAERQANQQSHAHPREGELQCGGQAQHDLVDHLLPRADGGTQVTLEQAAYVVGVLHRQRAVEPVGGAELLQLFRANTLGSLTNDGEDRVTRRHPRHQEDDEGDAEENRNQAQEAPGDIADQCLLGQLRFAKVEHHTGEADVLTLQGVALRVGGERVVEVHERQVLQRALLNFQVGSRAGLVVGVVAALFEECVYLGVAVARHVVLRDLAGVHEREESVVGVEGDGAPGGGVELCRVALDTLNVGGVLLHADVEVDAHVGKHRLEDLRDRLEFRVLVDVQAQAQVRGTGFFEERFGGFGVVGVGLVELCRETDGGRNRGDSRQSKPPHELLDDQFLVDRMRNSLANAHVFQLRTVNVEAQVGAAPAEEALGLDTSGLLEGDEVVGRDAEDDVEAAAAQFHDLRAYLRDDAEGHVGDRRLSAPVVLVCGKGDLRAVDPLLEGVRAGADGVAAQRVGVLCRYDRRYRVGEVREERREGRLGDDLDGKVVDDVHLVNRRDDEAAGCAGCRVDEALDRFFDDLRGERSAVVELDALTQGQVEAAGLRVLPLGGEARLNLALLGHAHERLVELVRDDEGEAVKRQLRVERLGVSRDRSSEPLLGSRQGSDESEDEGE